MDYMICEQCYGKAYPTIADRQFKYNDKMIVVEKIKGYECKRCHNVIYDSTNADKILKACYATKEKNAEI